MSELTKCKICGTDNPKIDYSPAEIGLCTCNACGNKFVIPLEGSNVVASYIAERGRIFAELETAKINGRVSTSAKRKLEELVRSHGALAEIDPVYYWYKISFLTDGFKDYSNFKEVEGEYRKISKNCFLVDGGDKTRTDMYKQQYDEYVKERNDRIHSADENKRKKKKAVILSVLSLLCAAVVGGGLYIGLYNPVLSDEATGISVALNNSANGLFGKFGTDAQIEKIEQPDEGNAPFVSALSSLSSKFTAYGVKLLSGGKRAELSDEVEITLPLPQNYRAANTKIFVYDGEKTEECDYTVDESGNAVFKAKNFICVGFAETPYALRFESEGQTLSALPVLHGANAEEPAEPTRKGYSFGGWFIGNTAYDFTQPVTGDLTLTAKWTANEYKITYMLDGAEVHAQNAVYNKQTALYVHDKTGYTVTWRDGENNVVTDCVWKTAEDTVLYGEAVANKYELTLDCGAEICCPAQSAGSKTVTAIYDSTLPAIAPPTRTGYKFAGYYTKQNGEGVKYYDENGSCGDIWQRTGNTTLYAKWEKDEAYSGYTYVSTYSDLRSVGEYGKYLLVNDIDMNGSSWAPIQYFRGTFDGGCHSIYNFKITQGTSEGGLIMNFGLFGTVYGTVKNLQVGKSGATTSIYRHEDKKRFNAGMIAGYCEGAIYNCRAVSCTVDLYTFAQDNIYKNEEFWINAGGICGNKYYGSIKRCTADGCKISTEVKVCFNHISAMARTGGIVGFANSTTVADCLTVNCNLISSATSNDGAWLNPSGKPNARTGCIMGTFVKWGDPAAVIERCAEASNTVQAPIHVGANTEDNTGTSYIGALIGETSGTTSRNLIGVLSGFNCSGTDPNYSGFTRITDNSLSALISTYSAFNNGLWIDDGGRFAVKFYEN